MKVNLEVECTPEEARRALGLPDLSLVHDRYIAMVLDSMAGVAKPELAEAMMRSWAPMNETGLALWRRLLEPGGKTAD